MIRAILDIALGLAITAGVVAMAAYCKAVEPNNVTLEYLMIAQVVFIGSFGLSIASDGWKSLKSAYASRAQAARK